jgi:hypothetical protein
MNTLVLLVDRGSAWSPQAWAVERGGFHVGDQVIIEQDTEWLSVVRDDRVLHELDDEERSRLAEWVAEYAIYLVEWKGVCLLKTCCARCLPRRVLRSTTIMVWLSLSTKSRTCHLILG